MFRKFRSTKNQNVFIKKQKKLDEKLKNIADKETKAFDTDANENITSHEDDPC